VQALQADVRWDGLDAGALRGALGVPRLELRSSVGSTQDVAHALASDGAPAGTLVLADAQQAGRGRQGRSWSSAPGRGIWMTLIGRPADARAVEVLSLRMGLAAARVLDAWSDAAVGLKWPNDLLLPSGKLGGILVEARWRQDQLDWVAVGVGINVRPPVDVAAASLRSDAARLDVLAALVPALVAATAATGQLTEEEVQEYGARDAVAGRAIVEPLDGMACGVAHDGALLVRTADGEVRRCRSGSLRLREDG
jgi:BirA family transcriptional regulator, biotin operon repressor / biotin---[acetyl-CoA-carboxylase] ligase